VDLGVQVSFSVWLTDVGHALTAQTEQLAVLRARRDLQRESTSVRGWNADFATQNHRRQGCRNSRAQVVSVSIEAGVGCDCRYQIEIARSAAGATGRTLARDAHSTAVPYSGWDPDLHSTGLAIRCLELQRARRACVGLRKRDLQGVLLVSSAPWPRRSSPAAATTFAAGEERIEEV
jgi:hypothetical protein